MSDKLQKLHPTAAVFRGDPRAAKVDLDEWYQWVLAEVEAPKSRPHLYGSDAGHCARRNVLLANNDVLPREVSATSQAYMAIGVAVEDMLAEALKKKQKLVGQGIRLPLLSQVKIAGILDLLTIDSEDELAIIEVKTCGKLPDEPKPQHVAQAQVYAAVTGIRKVWLSYISRNVQIVYGHGLSVQSFAVDTSDEALEARMKVALISDFCDTEKKLPPVPAHFRKHTECHICDFRDHYCWKPRPGRDPRDEGETPSQQPPNKRIPKGTTGVPLNPKPFGLDDITTTDYIELSLKADRVSKEIVSDCSRRKIVFLDNLNNSLEKDNPLRSILSKEIEREVQITIS